MVELESMKLRPSAPGLYEIRFLIPTSDRNPGDPSYRIKSILENYERVAFESELTLQ
jgi:hypothetical protein